MCRPAEDPRDRRLVVVKERDMAVLYLNSHAFEHQPCQKVSGHFEVIDGKRGVFECLLYFVGPLQPPNRCRYSLVSTEPYATYSLARRVDVPLTDMRDMRAHGHAHNRLVAV